MLSAFLIANTNSQIITTDRQVIQFATALEMLPGLTTYWNNPYAFGLPEDWNIDLYPIYQNITTGTVTEVKEITISNHDLAGGAQSPADPLFLYFVKDGVVKAAQSIDGLSVSSVTRSGRFTFSYPLVLNFNEGLGLTVNNTNSPISGAVLGRSINL